MIQPQVPLRLPCYDFTPVMNHKVVSALPKVKLPTSFATHSHGVTGGVYKARERIHRSILITITSDSDFMESSCRLNPDYDALYEVRLLSRGRFSLYAPL